MSPARSLAVVWLPCHACLVCSALSGLVRFLCMWALTAVSRLAMCACLAVSVFPGRLTLLPEQDRITSLAPAIAASVAHGQTGKHTL